MCSMCHLLHRITVNHYGVFRDNENCDAKIVPYTNFESYHKIIFCHIKILLVYHVALTKIIFIQFVCEGHE